MDTPNNKRIPIDLNNHEEEEEEIVIAFQETNTPKAVSASPALAFEESPHNTDYGDNFSNSPDTAKKKHYSVKTPKTKRRKSKARTIISVIVWILVILLLLGAVYLGLIIFRVQYTDQHPDQELITSMVGELKSSSDVENIMLFGIDNHAEGENGRSDSMILLSIDKKTHTMKQTSFLRDTYLTIPGYGNDRLNAAYSYGGAKLATETIEYNYHIRIDHYVIVDFSAFTAIIDTMGGIDVELEEEEIDYINWQCWKNKQVETRHELDINSYTFTENKNGENVALVHLNGRQALWHARNRGEDGICSGDDIVRAQRQREVIQSVFTHLKSSDPITMLRVFWEVAPSLTTDMSKLDVLGKIFTLPFYLGYERTEYSTPRSDNRYFDWINGSSVICTYDDDYERSCLSQYIYQTE